MAVEVEDLQGEVDSVVVDVAEVGVMEDVGEVEDVDAMEAEDVDAMEAEVVGEAEVEDVEEWGAVQRLLSSHTGTRVSL